MFKSTAPAPVAISAPTKTREKDEVVTGKLKGHRVLLVQPNSPAAKVGLVAYVDIITHVGDVQLDDANHTLAKAILPWIDQDVDVTVFNVRSKQARIAMLNPNRNWGGVGVLGLVARYDHVGTEDKAFLVNHVAEGSPAARAGLRAGEDYLLGAERLGARSEADVAAILQAPFTRGALTGGLLPPVLVYVFHAPTATVRVAALVPVAGRSWPNPTLLAAQQQGSHATSGSSSGGGSSKAGGPRSVSTLELPLEPRPSSSGVSTVGGRPPVSSRRSPASAPTASSGGAAVEGGDSPSFSSSSSSNEAASAAASASAAAASSALAAPTVGSSSSSKRSSSRTWWGGTASAPTSDTESEPRPSASASVPAAAAAPAAAARAAPSSSSSSSSGGASAPGTPARGRRYSRPEEYLHVKIPPRPPPRSGSVLHRQLADTATSGTAASGDPGCAGEGYASGGEGAAAGGAGTRSSSRPGTPLARAARETLPPTDGAGGGAGGSDGGSNTMLGSFVAGSVAVAFATATATNSLARSVRDLTGSLGDSVAKELTLTHVLMKELLSAPEGRWWPAYGLRTKPANRFGLPAPAHEDAPEEGQWLTPALGEATGLAPPACAARLTALGFGDMFVALPDPAKVRAAQAAAAAAAVAAGHATLEQAGGAPGAGAGAASAPASAAGAGEERAAGDSDGSDSDGEENEDDEEDAGGLVAGMRGLGVHGASGRRRSSSDSEGEGADGSGSDSEGSGSGAKVPGGAPACGNVPRRTRGEIKRESEALARRRAAQMGILSVHAGQLDYNVLAADVAVSDPAALLDAQALTQAVGGPPSTASVGEEGEGTGTPGTSRSGFAPSGTAATTTPRAGSGNGSDAGLLDKLIQSTRQRKKHKRPHPLKGEGLDSGGGGGGPAATNSFAGLGTSTRDRGGPGGAGAGKGEGEEGVMVLYSNPMSL